MTRDEAIKAVTEAWVIGETKPSQMVGMLAALGLIELDEPISASGLAEMALVKRFGPQIGMDVLNTIRGEGLKIVEA